MSPVLAGGVLFTVPPRGSPRKPEFLKLRFLQLFCGAGFRFMEKTGRGTAVWSEVIC